MSTLIFGQKEIPVKEWLKAGPIEVHKPAFKSEKNITGETFSGKKFLKTLTVKIPDYPEAGKTDKIFGSEVTWEKISVPEDSIVLTQLEGNNTIVLSTYISVNQWASIDLKIASNALFEVFIDESSKSVKAAKGLREKTISAELHKGKHRIDIKLISQQDSLKFNAKAEYDNDRFETVTFDNSVTPERTVNIHDILDGKKITSAEISPSGTYVLIDYKNVQKGSGESLSYKAIKNTETGENEALYRNADINGMKWLPESDKISYTVEAEDAKNLYIYDIKNENENLIAEGLEKFSAYWWSPNEEKLIYSVEQEAEDPKDLKRIYGNEDRIPGFRDRTFLQLLDIKSGDRIRLTAGNLSTSFHDFHPEGKTFLFSTSYPVYTELPYSKQNLYEMDLDDFSLDTIWKDKRYSGQAQYAPEGNKLLVQGGPLCFGDVGVNTDDDQIPNNYDGQLYLYNRANNQAKSLTRNFKPAISSADWITKNTIYLKVTEKSYSNVYKYNLENDNFEKIESKVEVINSVDFASSESSAVYRGTSISTPQQLYYLDIENESSQRIDQPKPMKHIRFGKTEKWNFVNERGTTIHGRVYYPPDYNEEKKYPVIVYYYGGTNPTSRSFDGRYPKNIWTSNGYIVYVLQPSGATGFGQKFSALHVKGWGKEQSSDIIEGTKKFLEAHPSADSENVGAIGASYGGYTTMYLQTQTDIFKTAVAHAGISSITSYWGEGYWGYSYNAVAAADTYPWNNKDLYVDNSPLYNADQFSNSILLLHGTADTNVPVGESKQFYAALKVLGKDAEMVLVKDQNHWVVGYDKRIQWHHTIMSWFAKELKDRPQLWKNMYPEKYLK